MSGPDGLQVVTAISVALATRLPMRDVERVHAEAGAGLVGDRYHGGSIFRVLESGDIAVGDVWQELDPELGAEVAAWATG